MSLTGGRAAAAVPRGWLNVIPHTVARRHHTKKTAFCIARRRQAYIIIRYPRTHAEGPRSRENILFGENEGHSLLSQSDGGGGWNARRLRGVYFAESGNNLVPTQKKPSRVSPP